MTFDNWQYHPDNQPHGHEALNEFYKAVQNDFLETIWDKIPNRQFFREYTVEACEQFVQHYAYTRMRAVVEAEQTIREIEGPRTIRYRPDTRHIYDLILQKKFFNAQCLWRAEQLELPGIWASIQFKYWENHIREWPYHEEVAAGEIAAMQAFLLDDNFEDHTCHWLQGWQDYKELIKKDSHGDQIYMPEWYQFYDSRLGTSYMLDLPDIRGDKENEYRQVSGKKYRKAYEKKRAEDEAAGIIPQKPEPYLSPFCPVNSEMCYGFALKFEDQYFQAIFKHKMNKERQKQNQNEAYEIEEYIAILEDAETPPYVQGGVNWREALKRTAQQYKNTIIGEDLELLHQEYLLLHDLKPKLSLEEISQRYADDGLVQMVQDQILEGRKLLGEPEDFNF